VTAQTETFLALGRRAVDAGVDWAHREGTKMTFVAMDVTGTVCAAARMDGSRTITYEIAVAKANTALAFQAATADLAQRVKPENKIAIGQLAQRIAFLGGGVPILRDGAIVGAIGVSGGTEDEDVACAAACIAAVSD
jgi:glc operon protein GlcG